MRSKREMKGARGRCGEIRKLLEDEVEVKERARP